MNDSETKDCYSWIYDFVDINSTSLEEMNEAFKRRNVGGIIFIIILSLIGLIGNSHVLWIYIRKFKSSNYRTYVLCLAGLDFINCTVGMPLTVVYLNFPLMFPSTAFCKIYRFLLYYVSLSSTIILVIIAADRYRKICHPLKRQLSEKEALVLCVFGLLCALVFAWPAPFLYSLSKVIFPSVNVTGYRCFTADSMKDMPYQKIYNSFLTFVFIIILTLLFVLYYFIIKAVKTHATFQSRNGQWPRPSNYVNDKNRTTHQHYLRRTTVTLLMVTIGYIASALPHHALAISIFVFPNLDCQMSFTGGIIYYTFVWIFLVNNVINPVIYSFSDKRFARQVKVIYKWCLCKFGINNGMTKTGSYSY